MRIFASVLRSVSPSAYGLGLLAALACSATSAADPVPVVRGAEWVSAASEPTVLTVQMRTLPAAEPWKPGDPIREIPRRFDGDPNAPVPIPLNPTFGDDPLVALQQSFVPRSTRAFSTPLVNLNVLSNPAIQPNDPTGDIGTLQFVGSVNSSAGAQFAVYNKSTGATVIAPTLMQGLGSGGACATGLGDPIVLFDELANRWVLTEFTDGANVLCVYLSNGADLSGSVTWTRYSFTLPSFPDYPKYGMWPDAYYVGANENNALYAMDRLKMLAGQAATLQRFSIADLAGFGFQMAQPADLAGTAVPAAGAPGIFMRHRDDESHNVGSNNPNSDFLEMFEFHVDWQTPANSSIAGPISIPMAEFSSNLNGLSAFNAFPQPSGTKIDPLRETVMHRLTYRNMGSYEMLVGNLVTDLFLGAGSTYPDDTGAVRWFELRRALGPPDAYFADGFESATRGSVAAWTLHQQGTFAPADGTPAEQADRWMAASSIDESGNIALAYNVVRQAPAISAGLRYTGRLSSDPLGLMTAGENLIVDGSGSVSGQRWGDYNDMGIDPVDGCTFWFIGNYSSSGSRTNRAASFKFDECGGPGFTLTSPAPATSVCATSASPVNASPITINAAATNGFVGSVTMSYPNAFAAGISGTLAPTTIASLPGSSVAQLTASNAATPGTSTIIARGTAGAVVRNLQLSLTIATANPAVPTLVAPANNAMGVSANPTFTWNASAQAATYLVQASTSAAFATTLFSQTVTGTSLVSPVALPTNQQIFWRVQANNICGTNDSAVFSYNGPTFTMNTATPSVAVCANAPTPSNAAPISLDLTPVNGFVGSVALSYPNAFATGISGTLTPNPVPSLPGSSVAQLSATNAAAAGPATIVARATAGATIRDVSLTLNVVTAGAPAPALTAPANAATNVVATPTFTWAASAQATNYLIEASTSNTFATTLFSQTVTGTSLVSPLALPTNTQIFWRVRANNVCANNTSTVFSFTTAAAPGDCPAGPAPTIVASEDFEGAATGWVPEAGGTGTNTWAITTAFPFAGTKALRGLTPATASDQRFISPAFSLPAVGNGLTLSFQSRQQMEPRTGGCWDGGFIEVSVGGAPYTQITTGLLTDPYDGPLGSGSVAAPAPAWCGDPQAYLKSVIDLAPYAGQSNVRFRFRISSDTSVGRTEGWNIDNVEIKRCN